MSIEGRTATVNRQKARRAVVAGKARWIHERPMAVEVRQPATTPTRHVRRGFGEGLLRSLPTYRLDCTLEDLAFWEVESRMEEERMFDRLAQEAAAMDRLENGLEPW